MTRIVNNRPHPEPGPVPRRSEKKQRTSRQRRERQKRDAEYLVLRDIYLEENPRCAVCEGKAVEVHHIVCGVAGRARSLLNSDTWLGVCSKCHEEVEGLHWLTQVELKQVAIKETVLRLMK